MWFDTHSDYYPFNGELFPLTDLDTSLHQDFWLPIFGVLNVVYTLLALFGAIMLAIDGWPRSRLWLSLVLLMSLPRIAFFWNA
jgi:hypothetical protein